jgi:hypothetical protein
MLADGTEAPDAGPVATAAPDEAAPDDAAVEVWETAACVETGWLETGWLETGWLEAGWLDAAPGAAGDTRVAGDAQPATQTATAPRARAAARRMPPRFSTAV